MGRCLPVSNTLVGELSSGADDGNRTRDIHFGRVTLYLLSYVHERLTRFELATFTLAK